MARHLARSVSTARRSSSAGAGCCRASSRTCCPKACSAITSRNFATARPTTTSRCSPPAAGPARQRPRTPDRADPRGTSRLFVTQGQDALEMSVTADPLEEGVSLSGVQPKLGVIRDGERYVGRTKDHDTHIIAKLPVVGQPLLPEVEALELAAGARRRRGHLRGHAGATGASGSAAWLRPRRRDGADPIPGGDPLRPLTRGTGSMSRTSRKSSAARSRTSTAAGRTACGSATSISPRYS